MYSETMSLFPEYSYNDYINFICKYNILYSKITNTFNIQVTTKNDYRRK
jgi:hypothetical protein